MASPLYPESLIQIEKTLARLARLLGKIKPGTPPDFSEAALDGLLEAAEAVIEAFGGPAGPQKLLSEDRTFAPIRTDLAEVGHLTGLLVSAIRANRSGLGAGTDPARTHLAETIALSRSFLPRKARRLARFRNRMELRERMAAYEGVERLNAIKPEEPPHFRGMQFMIDPGSLDAPPEPKDKDPFAHASRIVPVFFATDRKKRDNTAITHTAFEDGRGPMALTYGIAEVSIPPGHKPGHMERPLKIWKFQFDESLDKHIVIESCEVKDLPQWRILASERVQKTGNRTALVFIHGFNVSFDDAVRQAAQIGADLNYGGLVAAYSWASEYGVKGYGADGDSITLTVPLLAEFFRMLRSDLKLDAVHVIAHSMGNRALVQALEKMELPSAGSWVNEAILAAPDIDADVLRLALAGLKGKAVRYTLYGSNTDWALKASKSLRGHPRAGDGGDNLFVAPGVDSIDASLVGGEILGLGHSYYSKEKSVLSDIHYIVKQSLGPDARFDLLRKEKDGLFCWVFQP